MIVSTLIALKKRCSALWQVVEWGNGQLFGLLHPSLSSTASNVLKQHIHYPYQFSLLEQSDVEALAQFLGSQTADTLNYFHPHAFDIATLQRLQRNKAFLMMKVTDTRSNQMVGYFFLRCFFIGRAFHGLIVDSSAKHQGIGSNMWKLASEICQQDGLRMFATISSDNAASYSSCKRGTDERMVELLANGYLLVECKAKNA